MEPFKVECIDAGLHGGTSNNELILHRHYTVVEIEPGSSATFYYLAETGTDYWSSGRFVKVEKKTTIESPIEFLIATVGSQATCEMLQAALTQQFPAGCSFVVKGNKLYFCDTEKPIPGFDAIKELKTAVKFFAVGYVARLP